VRFSSLRISNFRAIRSFEVFDLSDFIVIAGTNGCGKSCVLDALRLLKSIYGGYQADEWRQWFGEFQINLDDPTQLLRLLRDTNVPCRVAATVELAAEEKEYLRVHTRAVLEPLTWQSITGQNLGRFGYSTAALATQYRQYGERVERKIEEDSVKLLEALDEPENELAFTIDPDRGLTDVLPSPVMEVVFQTYDPGHLGVIDYHSASRNYQREQVGGVNLNVDNAANQQRSQALYNWQAKYQHVKTELANNYVRALISEKAGIGPVSGVDINETLKELFQTFFPDKEYLGVQPTETGGLLFPVKVNNGGVHDLNDLSSGEKEVVYGYLRLRASAPRYSSILLDEPELHLNPGLLRGFPDFYHRHLGQDLGNQLWLVTHSDTLLRQAVGNHNYSVFHMISASSDANTENQALIVEADNELERATIDLVGDLATYRPKSKVVLFEGGGDTEVDVLIVQRLFPDFARVVNLVSGGSKRRVLDLYEILQRTASEIGMADRFFAITDKDTAPWEVPSSGTHQMSWDVYHIENYLLEPEYVRAALQSLYGEDRYKSDSEVRDALRLAAEAILPRLVLQRLQKSINDRLVSAISIRGRPDADPSSALTPAITATFERLDLERAVVTDPAKLATDARSIASSLKGWLDDETWLREFPGREILKEFKSTHPGLSVSYDIFRNMVVSKMVDAGFQPSGMRAMIDRVLSAPS
jgi:hypothetical protein